MCLPEREIGRVSLALGAFDLLALVELLDAPVGDGDLREMLAVLALDGLLAVASPEPPEEVVELLRRRERLRQARRYAEADVVRERIIAWGWQVRDGPAGPELVPARR